MMEAAGIAGIGNWLYQSLKVVTLGRLSCRICGLTILDVVVSESKDVA